MDTSATSKGSNKSFNNLVVSIGIFSIVLVAAMFALVFKYRQTVNAVEGIPRAEFALVLTTEAYSVISDALETEDKLQIVDCYSSDTNQVICKSTGNVLHIHKFEAPRSMPNFKLHALRGNDGKFLELELSGIPDKLQSREVDELLQIFKKPIN